MRNIIVILLFSAQFLTAQQGFIKAYSFDFSTPLRFNAMLLDNDEVVICGYVIDTVAPFSTGVLFTKFDTLGNVVNFNSYYDPDGFSYVPGSDPGSLIKLQNNLGYLFVGNMLEGSGGFLMKFDLNGNILWTKILEENIQLQGFYKCLIEVEDGFLIAGRKFMSNGQGDIFLMKTDKDGNKLWEKSYGLSSRNDDATNLLRINNNEYIIGGHIGPNQGVPWEEWHHQIQIFAVDSLGNEKWYWESDPMEDEWNEEDMSCRGLHRDNQGNWSYATTFGEFQDNGGLFFPQAKFVKRDSTFNIIEERVYDDLDGDRTELLNMIPLTDGDFLMLGNNYEFFESNSTIQHVYGWMVRGTSQGDSLWTRYDLTFPNTGIFSRQYLHSAVELPSGSIIAAGYYNGLEFSDHGLLIKVNQHGCIDWDDCTPTNLPNSIFTPNTSGLADLHVYPNPVRSILHFESEQIPQWDKVELLDMAGQVMKTIGCNKKITLEGLPSGMYVLRLWKNGRFWARKIIRQ